MSRVPSTAGAPDDPALDEGFGRLSTGVDPENGDQAEFLELAPALVEHAGFVAALGERVARFASVRHTSYVHLRRLDRPAPDRLVLVSDLTPGWRLSDLLREAGEPLETTVVIGVLRQLLPAVALFGRHNRDSAIGALGPERLIVTPQARLVIAEHAFGSAIEKLNYGRDRLWREFRVAMPPSAGLPRANPRADAHAEGLIALSLLVGRPLAAGEFPGQVQALVDTATELRGGERVPLSPAFAQWLARALQLDVRTAFQSPHEAQVAFEAVLASERAYVTTPAALEAWVQPIGARIDARRAPGEPREPEPAPSPEPPPAPEPTPPPLASSSAPPAPPLDQPVESAARADADRRSTPSRLVPALGAIVIVLAALVTFLWTRPPAPPLDGVGELVVQSRPASARVSIDGEERGVTPLTIELGPGAHVLEVQVGRAEPRVIPLTIRAGVQTAQYVELQNVPLTGGLDVRSEPTGARVSVDGQPRGRTPLALRELPPGDHEVVVESGGRRVRQVVRIDAGITAQLVVPLGR